MPTIIDTYKPWFPFIEGDSFTDYNAENEFIFQMNSHFKGLFSFEVLSKRGNITRTDALLKGTFKKDGFSNNTFYVYVFILYEGGAGRSREMELRTQLTSGSRWTPSLKDIKVATRYRDAKEELSNLECYCIGIYKQDKDCKNVLFVGMPAEVLCKSEMELINPTSTFQTEGEYIRKAYLDGVSLHRKTFSASSTYNLLLFKPEYFLWYMKERDHLHVGDVDKAMKLVKEAPSVVTPSLVIAKDKPLQMVFYGAPGTGKSDTIERIIVNEPHERTTFHPDSDYASFVGAYKPTMKEKGDENEEDKIIYNFIPQAFLKAYVKAWKSMPNPFYLIIEEINRGNCAQIFGDLFQLLDRDQYGYSKYPITPDDDIRTFLSHNKESGFGNLNDGQKKCFPNEEVMNGKKLQLPPNLRIWATMNTSDQSLFPIDSAFKRRWEWKYIKITNGYKKDEAGNFIKDAEGKKIPMDWKIETNGEDWYGFICQINRIISNMTSSADKQLGYFFCQANEDGKITTETFVSKVIFYLWNDVFKDYGFEDANLFKYKTLEGDKEVEKDLTFPDFYDEDGNVAPDVVKQFIEHVMAWKGDEKKNNN